MSLIRQLVSQTAVYGLGHIISKILYFVVLTTYLTTRIPDTKEYGIYAEFYAYAALLIVFLSYRIDTAFFRFGSKKDDLINAFNTAFFPLVFTTVVIVSLGVFFAEPIAHLIGYPDHPHYVRWFSLILGFDVLVLLPFGRLRLENKPLKFISYRIFNIIFTIILVLFFLECMPLLSEGHFIKKLISEDRSKIEFVFIANLIASATLFLLMIPVLNILNGKIDWSLWKKMFLYSLPLIVVGLAGSFNQFFAVPLQKFLLGNSFDENLTQAGIYAAPQRIAALLALFTTAFNYAAEPFFFRNVDKKESKELYGVICLLFVMVGGVMVLGLFFYIDWFQFLIGENYRSGLVIVPILLIAYLLLGVYYNVSIWYKLADKTIYGALIASLGAFITFVFSFIFLPKWGYIASAWAAVLTYLIMNILVYLLGQKHFPIAYPVKKIAFVFSLIVACVLLAQGINHYFNSQLFQMLLKSTLLIVYIAIIFSMERNRFTSLWQKKT